MTEARKPVKYTVLEKSLIGNTIYEAGEVAEYDGYPGSNLAPTCPEGEARVIEAQRVQAEASARNRALYAESAVGDASQFAAAFAAELAKQNASIEARIAEAVAEAVAKALAAPKAAAKTKDDKPADPPLA